MSSETRMGASLGSAWGERSAAGGPIGLDSGTQPPATEPRLDRRSSRNLTASWGATWEVAGAWLLVVLAGIALGAMALANLQWREVKALREARLLAVLQDIRPRLEATLARGRHDAVDSSTQALLLETVAVDDALIAIDVIDADGAVMFSTDRGSIGETVHPRWLMAMTEARAPGSAWKALAHGDAVLGLPLENATGAPAVHVAATHRQARPLAPWPLAAGAVLSMVAALALAAWGRRRLRPPRHDSVEAVMRQAMARLDASQASLQSTLQGLAPDNPSMRTRE